MRIPRRTTIFAIVVGGGAYGAWSYGLNLQKLSELAGPAVTAKVTEMMAPKAATPAGRPVAPPSLVLTQTATQETFVVNKRTIGFVEPMAQVVIKARLDSQIASQNVRDGTMVKAGDVLFTLDDRELQAQIARDVAQLVKDRATLAKTVADLGRKKDLVEKGAGTAQAFDSAVADEAVARATLAADEAAVALDQTRLSYTVIKSPIDGRAGVVNTTPGNVIKAADVGPGLVTITQIQPIRVSLQISERELSKLQALFSSNAAPKVTVYQSGSDKILAAGGATFLDSAVDLPSGTVTVKAEFANADSGLWPGMFVDVDVALETFPAATVIPTVAAQIGQKGSYVFVMKPDQTVELRPIVVAATQGASLAVASGLAPGERVVVEGQGRLVNGAKVRDGTPETEPKKTSDGRTGAVATSEKPATGQGE